MCALVILSLLRPAAQAASPHQSNGIGTFLTSVGHDITSVFVPAPASAHAHRRTRHVRKPVHHPEPGFGVPQGTIAAHALTSTDTTLPLVEWDGRTTTLQTATQAAKPAWMAVLVTGTQLVQACEGKWVHPVDSTPTCGIPGGVSDIALTWDRSRLTTAPTWQDFWDVARHPGRRGLHFGARTTLEIALLADGVAPQDIYSTLSTSAGVERALRRLDLLRPYIVWWETPADAARIMEQSGALMLSAPATEVTSVSARAPSGPATSLFVAGTQGVLRSPLFWAIPTNVSAESAHRTLEQLRMHAPHLEDMPVPVPPEKPPTFLTVSDTFWSLHGEALEQQFEARFVPRTP
ncbi:ABC transporter substrate-binding protein [Gluconobacter albidus]|uniref:ABC transporter substrate-binding protein n=1 Tax=Gluconobacter albidus TaxID=318683 RepID=A0AAW3R0K6_9PROT|nr:ABC transporter substrate-binding protein [Gluconobacter albidus]KXV42391.1 ABC transporter substrate-binding protein [Gluconobacter albidus]